MLRMQSIPLSERRDSLRYIAAFRSLHSDKQQTRVSFGLPITVTGVNLTETIGANFTTYQELKKAAAVYQPELEDLPSYQHMVIGLISGATGPLFNAPIDTIKTRTILFPSVFSRS